MYVEAFVDGILATFLFEVIVIMGLAIWAALKGGK